MRRTGKWIIILTVALSVGVVAWGMHANYEQALTHQGVIDADAAQAMQRRIHFVQIVAPPTCVVGVAVWVVGAFREYRAQRAARKLERAGIASCDAAPPDAGV